MLSYKGFIKSEIFKVESDETDFKLLSIHYYVENLELLNDYFINYASGMQNEGKKLFRDKFSAERRLLSKLD